MAVRNIIFHVVIFDEYGEHYNYNKNEINLDETEPATKFASEILNKINFHHNDNVNTQLKQNYDKESIPEPIEKAGIITKESSKSIEPEILTIQRVRKFLMHQR